MEPSRRSFSLRIGSSFRIARLYKSALVSEKAPECAGIASYERLSNSMRLSDDEYSPSQNNKVDRDWGLLGKVFFSFRKASVDVEAKRGPDNVKRKKKRSSWLPDPHQKRWPVQGW